MLILKQSTAIDIRMGPFVDVTNGVTPETGITLAGADQAEVLKANGAATAAMAGTFAAVTGADGWYDYTASTTDTNTVGEVVFVVQDASVCLPVFVRAYVVEEAVYDAMYGASAAGPLQSTTAGRTLDVSAGGEAGVDWANVGSPTTAVNLSGTNIKTDQVVASVSGAVGSVTGAVGSVTGAVGSVTGAVGSVTANVTIDAASVDAIWDETLTAHVTADSAAVAVKDILVDTAEIGTAGAGLTNINLPDQTMNITGNLSGSVGSVTGAVGSVTASVTIDAGSVDAIWDETLTAHATADSAAVYVKDVLTDTGTTIPGTITTLQADTDDIQTRLPAALVGGKMDANVSAIAGVAASATNLEASTDTILSGTASGVPTTTAMISDIAVTVNDQFNGRTIIFASDTTTAALQGQATDITACTAATNTLTFTALTTAPASGDTFVIV